MSNERMQTGFKETFFYQIARKIAYKIFPWKKVILNLENLYKNLYNEYSLLVKKCSSLREEINFLRNNNARLDFTAAHLKNDNCTEMVVQDQESWSKVPLDEIAGMLNWPEVLQDFERMNGFGELMRLLLLFSKESNEINNPSNCWALLAAKNFDQLLENGYSNFKRTIGHNYFNFLVRKGDAQIQALESLLTEEAVVACRNNAMSIQHDPAFIVDEQFSYKYFVLLLWEYVKKIDKYHYIEKLNEPIEGNPILVHSNGKAMSQDLANSIIEYYSINDEIPLQNVNTVLEIGGGYGRNAFVILSLNPNAKVFLVDILPALYIAQRYLCSVFQDRKIFRARSFDSYEEVKEEIEAASIIYLFPNQLALMPDKYFDLCMNISSFGEMSPQQIEWYFQQINRLTRSHFYMKQWDVSQNPFDGLVLKKSDYPHMKNWQEIYSRNCAIQTEFFETLYQVNNQ